MSVFGWSYPAGAENDPHAPWNQDADEDMPDDEGAYEAMCGLKFSTQAAKSSHERKCKSCRWEYDCYKADMQRDE